ncbi:enoyl-CoA hydratase/isomerase family protein [Alkalicoccus urumqiensis]|uniref:2-(1,2-epoxy-1,2-dihydrophenyl)acetyl-CoA isomerase n=1 Tax=Alkalicoccus urumqiensis TaxID=1548213 RepID=A0A2P6ME20_ALKUR|nr:enoyl-CoA hydratase-related protein [Alkalicoccus urumqiensis]PRO64514.1 2-(1,2-epoxy-1,2-dihydrophenyl)acetyl-CoA isomerase [Alkalicoccus urumqiensis]
MTYEAIHYVEKDGAAWITLDRPEAFNAMTPAMNKEIKQAVKQADTSEAVRVLVFTGSGRSFCAGEDLEGVNEHTDHGEFLRSRYHPMLSAVEACGKPTVALINGVAAGAGMSLALACDFRLMNEKAKFVSAFIDVGLVPDSGFLYYLTRIAGEAAALEMAVFSRPMDAALALEKGLATRTAAADSWEEEAFRFVQELAAKPTTAVRMIKRLVRQARRPEMEAFLEREAQAQRIAGKSADHQEGLAAFKEKRTPAFTGS